MQSSDLLPVSLLVVALVGAAITFILVQVRRAKTGDSALSPTDEGETAQPEIEEENWVAIVDQLDSIERANKQHMHKITAALMESDDWQALARQFDTLLDRHVEHLKAVSTLSRRSGMIRQALHHTRETYRLSCLISALHEHFVAGSDVVSGLLDEWFLEHRATTTSRIRTKVRLDCARVLLLDLDYARPSPKTALAQLELAEKHRSAVCPSDDDVSTPCSILKSEIALRMERLTENLPPEKQAT